MCNLVRAAKPGGGGREEHMEMTWVLVISLRIGITGYGLT